MADRQENTPKQKTIWRIDHQAVSRVGHALYETAWAAAWPHLDDWFMPESFFIGRGRARPAIA